MSVQPFEFRILSHQGIKNLRGANGLYDRLLSSVHQLEQIVQQKNWEQAEDKSKYATEAWKKISNRVQYSVEREYMHEITGVLARIKGGVKAEDDKAILEEIYFFYDLWDNLGEQPQFKQ
jgi:hypothetical protein